MPEDTSSEKELTTKEESNLLALNFSDLHPKVVERFSQLSDADQKTFFIKTIDGVLVASNPVFLYQILVHNHKMMLKGKESFIITVPEKILEADMAFPNLVSWMAKEHAQPPIDILNPLVVFYRMATSELKAKISLPEGTKDNFYKYLLHNFLSMRLPKKPKRQEAKHLLNLLLFILNGYSEVKETLEVKEGEKKILDVLSRILKSSGSKIDVTDLYALYSKQKEQGLFTSGEFFKAFIGDTHGQLKELFDYICEHHADEAQEFTEEMLPALEKTQAWKILLNKLDGLLKEDKVSAKFIVENFKQGSAKTIRESFDDKTPAAQKLSKEAIIKLFVAAKLEWVSSLLQREKRCVEIEFSVYDRGRVSKEKIITLYISAMLGASGEIISFLEEEIMKKISDNKVDYIDKKISIEIVGFGKSDYQIAKKFSRQNLELTVRYETKALEKGATDFGKTIIERYLPIVFEAIDHKDFVVLPEFIDANKCLLTTILNAEYLNQASVQTITKLLAANRTLALLPEWAKSKIVMQALSAVIDGEPVEVEVEVAEVTGEFISEFKHLVRTEVAVTNLSEATITKLLAADLTLALCDSWRKEQKVLQAFSTVINEGKVEIAGKFISEFRDVLSSEGVATNLSEATITKLLTVDPTLALCDSWRKEQKVMQALSGVIEKDGFEVTANFVEELKEVSVLPHGLANQYLNPLAITKLITADPTLALLFSWRQNKEALQALSTVINEGKVEITGEDISGFRDVLSSKVVATNLSEATITKLLTADPTLALCDSWRSEDKVLKALSVALSSDQCMVSEEFIQGARSSQLVRDTLQFSSSDEFSKNLQQKIKVRKYMSLHTWNKWGDVEAFYCRYTDPEMRDSFLEPLKIEWKTEIITDTIKQAFFNQLLFAVKYDAELKKDDEVKALLDTLDPGQETDSTAKTKKTEILNFIRKKFNSILYGHLLTQSETFKNAYKNSLNLFAPHTEGPDGVNAGLLTAQQKTQADMVELRAQLAAEKEKARAMVLAAEERASAAETRASDAEKAAAELRVAKEEVEARNSQLLASLQRQLKDYQTQLIELGAEKAKAESIIKGLKETIVHLGAGAKGYLAYVIGELERIAALPVRVSQEKRGVEKTLWEEFEIFLKELQNNLESMQEEGILFIPNFEFAIAPPGSQSITFFGDGRRGAATDTVDSAANRYDGIADPTAPPPAKEGGGKKAIGLTHS
jgi:hypothetical protein